MTKIKGLLFIFFVSVPEFLFQSMKFLFLYNELATPRTVTMHKLKTSKKKINPKNEVKKYLEELYNNVSLSKKSDTEI
jgi:protease II